MSISDHSENEVKLTEVENKRKKKYTSLRKLCSPKRVRILGKDIQFRFLERQAKRRKEICKAYLSPCFVIRNNEIVYSNYNQKFLEDLKKNYTYSKLNELIINQNLIIKMKLLQNKRKLKVSEIDQEQGVYIISKIKYELLYCHPN